MPLRACVLLLLVAGCVMARAPRRTVVLPQSVSENDSTIRWYDVEGDTPEALRRALERLGPLDSDGQRHDGYTEWLVKYHFTTHAAGAGCRISGVETSLRVKVTLPRWAASSQTSPEMIDAWRAYLEALWLHENGHREIAARASAEIEAFEQNLEPQGSCAEAETVANRAAKAVIAQHHTEDRKYDELTRHGATQGATFP